MSGRQAQLRMWQQPDGLWRWSYAESGTTLYSHMAYDSAEEARHSARTAYPDLQPPPLPAAEAPAPPARRRRRHRAWLALVAVLLLYLLLRRGRGQRRSPETSVRNCIAR